MGLAFPHSGSAKLKTAHISSQPNPQPDPAPRLQVVQGGRLGPKDARQFYLVILVSVLVVIPCVWLPQIESFDLCSHIYNAWLSRLITEQHLPGLWIARQSTNIFFDHLLAWFITPLGPVLAQRVAVGASVLLFFWSSFVLVSVISGKRPWFLLPCLAILSYGRIYHYGFFNFYDSMAFGFLALALLWDFRPWRFLLAIPMLAFSWSAHPLPALWAVGMAAFVWIGRKGGRKVQILLLCSGAAALVAIRIYERMRFRGTSGPNEGFLRKVLTISGWDQVLAFDHVFSFISYRFVELGMLVIFVLLLVQVVRKERKFSVPLQLYALACIACLLIPSRKFYLYDAAQTPLGFITERLTLVASVLGCAVIAAATPRMWQRVALLVLAGIFFLAAHQDESSLVRLETSVDRLVSQLPPLQRVAAMLDVSRCRGRIYRKYRRSRLCRTLLQLWQLRSTDSAVSDSCGPRQQIYSGRRRRLSPPFRGAISGSGARPSSAPDLPLRSAHHGSLRAGIARR